MKNTTHLSNETIHQAAASAHEQQCALYLSRLSRRHFLQQGGLLSLGLTGAGLLVPSHQKIDR